MHKAFWMNLVFLHKTQRNFATTLKAKARLKRKGRDRTGTGYRKHPKGKPSVNHTESISKSEE